MTTRVVIADDHDVFLDGLAMLVGSQRGYAVVGQASTGAEVVTLSEQLQPDLVLLDVEMDGWPVFRTIRSVKRAAPSAQIAILTMHTDRVLRDQVLGAGASAFLTKGMAKTQLISALDEAIKSHGREPLISRTMPLPMPLLSPREEQVVLLLAEALSNREIAKTLSISEGTVKRHTGNIYEKLAARSRIDAVTKARLLGIL